MTKEALKAKAEDLKAKVDLKFWQLSQWAKENKELLIASVPVAVVATKGLFKITNSIIARGNLNKEEEMKEKFIYDRSTGYYIELKKPLRQTELHEIAKRRSDGERLMDILIDMNAIK